jgi:pSer/pThr/pTyr-binding forkhead associated (FHA) protein
MGITVGRTENNDLVLDHSSISRFHAYFLRDSRAKTWKLVDAESKNGTWVGPLRLERGATAPVQDRTRLRFGYVDMTFLEPESFFRHVERLINAT